jgi:hypothetical protein
MVQNAVRELQFTGETKPETPGPAPTKAQCRQLIDDILGQLLVLVRQKASYDILTEKVEALHRQIHTLFATSKARH